MGILDGDALTDITGGQTLAAAGHAARHNDLNQAVQDVVDQMQVVVNHGATAGTARPAGATFVKWVGSVEPTNATDNDEWWDTTADLVKLKQAGAFVASGTGTYVADGGVDTLANRPAASADNAGMYYVVSDEDGGTLYRSNGTSWVKIAPGLTVEQYAVKSADQTVNNSATPVADNHLSFTVDAGTYLFDAFIIYDAATAADLKLSWLRPSAGSNVQWVPNGLATNTAASDEDILRLYREYPQSGGCGGAGVGTQIVALPSGRLVADGSGTFQLQWAQNTADASDTTVYAGSWLRIRKVA